MADEDTRDDTTNMEDEATDRDLQNTEGLQEDLSDSE
jgi:hypothetical protein